MLKDFYRVGLGFAPPLDQTLVSGCWVTSSNASDDRFIQLREDKERKDLKRIVFMFPG